VRLTTTDANLVVTGRVVRSRVKGVVNGALRYDAALALDGELALAPPEEPAAPEPEPAPQPDPLAAEAPAITSASPEIVPDTAVELDPAPLAGEAVEPEWEPHPDEPLIPATDDAGADESGVLQLYASVPHDLAELRRIAADNQW
jgi:hypothetical protein